MEKNNLKKIIDMTADYYFSGQVPSDLIYSSNKMDLEKRFQTFCYGFSARTQTALSHHLPRTKNLLGPDNWNLIGKEFSHQMGVLVGNLNEISYLYPEFLKFKNINKSIISLAEIEVAALKLQRANYLMESDGIDLVTCLSNGLPIQLKPSAKLMYSYYDPHLEITSENLIPIIIKIENGNPFVFKLTPSQADLIEYLIEQQNEPIVNQKYGDLISFFQENIPTVLKLNVLTC